MPLQLHNCESANLHHGIICTASQCQLFHQHYLYRVQS